MLEIQHEVHQRKSEKKIKYIKNKINKFYAASTMTLQVYCIVLYKDFLTWPK